MILTIPNTLSVPRRLYLDKQVTPNAKLLYAVLAANSDNAGTIQISAADAAISVGRSDVIVRAWLLQLERGGCVKRIETEWPAKYKLTEW